MKRRSRGILIGAVLLLSAGLVWQQQRHARGTKADPAATLRGIGTASPEADRSKDGAPGPGLAGPPSGDGARPDRTASTASGAAVPVTAPAVLPEDPTATLTPPAMSPEPLISQAGKQSLIARDGTPLRIELVPGNPASAVEMQAWTDDQNRNAEGQYPWRFKIKLAGGGLVERADPAGFLAPESGYAPEFEQVMNPATAGKEWRNTMSKSFFVRLDNGTYGLVNLQMVAGGAHFVTLKSYLNPAAGSRNLTLPPPPPTKQR